MRKPLTSANRLRAAALALAGLAGLGTAAAQPVEDPFLWLEDVQGATALAFAAGAQREDDRGPGGAAGVQAHLRADAGDPGFEEEDPDARALRRDRVQLLEGRCERARDLRVRFLRGAPILNADHPSIRHEKRTCPSRLLENQGRAAAEALRHGG